MSLCNAQIRPVKSPIALFMGALRSANYPTWIMVSWEVGCRIDHHNRSSTWFSVGPDLVLRKHLEESPSHKNPFLMGTKKAARQSVALCREPDRSLGRTHGYSCAATNFNVSIWIASSHPRDVTVTSNAYRFSNTFANQLNSAYPSIKSATMSGRSNSATSFAVSRCLSW